MIDLVPRAKVLLPQVMHWCDPDAAACAELRAAGVAESRIRALYSSFDLDGYLACCAQLLRDAETFYPLSQIFGPASDSAVASAPAAISGDVEAKLRASTYEQLAGDLPARSPSSQTRRTPRVIFRQWTHTLLYLNALAKQPRFFVESRSIPFMQLGSVTKIVKDGERYFKQPPA